MPKVEKEQFWLVWREDSSMARYRHPSKQHAMIEAERLAKLNPGECFYVLKATGGVVADAPEVSNVKFYDALPF